MKDVPKCLENRYRVLDEVLKDLRTSTQNMKPCPDCECGCKNDRGLQLLCDFWNIVKKEPVRTPAIQRCLKRSENNSRPKYVACYMGSCGKPIGNCGKPGGNCDQTDSCDANCGTADTGEICEECNVIENPIDSVLCDFRQAATFEEQCSGKLKELKETEEKLKVAVQKLEAREMEGVKMLREADGMWMTMEETYKKRIQQSTDRQKLLVQQLLEVQISTKKWRKNMKDLESEIVKVDKCHEEVKEKISQKSNDLKCIDMEIEDMQKRLDSSKRELEASKKTLSSTKEASDQKIAKYTEAAKDLAKVVAEENKMKREKEIQGTKYIKEAREDLQKICGVLLKKKLENEDMKAEKAALSSEIELLLQARDKCRDKCDFRQKSLENDIKKMDNEIIEQQKKCWKCNQCTDTVDIHRFCNDCPRCLKERCCEIKGSHCDMDHTMDCVCMSVKRKFLDNVFENMYTVLERKVKKGGGKAIANQILDCLKRSRNGKLDHRTRETLQEFILTTVKRHLNLTIVGGAVKTRCEMDPDTYKQLMVCLQQIQVTAPYKQDKSTISKKAPCNRWGGSGECNCPKGPNYCVCTKKSLQPPHDDTAGPSEDEDEAKDDVKICSHKENTICGTDCAKRDEKFKEMLKEIVKSKSQCCQKLPSKASNDKKTVPCVYCPEPPATVPTRDCGLRSSRPVCDWEDQIYCDCPSPATYSKCNEKETKQQLSSKTNIPQPTIKTRSINLNDYFMKIAKTNSGASVIEINKNFLKVIEENTKVNSTSQINLKITDSGHFLVCFDCDTNNVDIDRIMILKNIIPGCLFFEGNLNVSKLVPKMIDNILLGNSNLIGQFGEIKPNAILRETPSGAVLIIATEPLELVQKRILDLSPETYSKIKVLQDNSVDEFPGVLKLTSSCNYVLAIDKEFEKSLQNTVKSIVADDRPAILTLRRSDSGSHLVKFGCFDSEPKTEIGIIKKTRSGNIKIISNVPHDASIFKESIIFGSDEATKLSKYCIDLLQNLQKKVIYHQVRLLKQGSLYKKKPLYTDTILPLNKTKKESQIQVSLNDELKKKVLNRIKSYLADSSKSLPNKGTASDTTVIYLRRRDSKTPVTMKIIRSQDINVQKLNERTIKGNPTIPTPFNSVNNDLSNQTIQIKRLNNKLVDTNTSNKLKAKDSESSRNYSNRAIIYRELSKLIESQNEVTKKLLSKNVSSLNSYSADSVKTKMVSNIAIKPTKKMSFVYNNNKYNRSSVPNSNFSDEDYTVTEVCDNSCRSNRSNEHTWNSLSYLPLQLPSFLDNVIHYHK